MADTDLCTVEEVRNFLQKPNPDTQQDLIIAQLISAASRAIQRFTEREFVPQATGVSRQLWYDGSGVLSLAPYDLRTFTSAFIDSASGAGGTALLATQYLLRPKPNPDGVYTWLELFPPQGPFSYFAEREVTITGNWGWPSVPADVKHWCAVTVATWMRRDVSAFTTTFNIDEQHLERPEALPSAVSAGLWRYKRPSVY